nr:hypothetical protein L204_06165 [Cryptococcus depauperatus CBS 7855]
MSNQDQNMETTPVPANVFEFLLQQIQQLQTAVAESQSNSAALANKLLSQSKETKEAKEPNVVNPAPFYGKKEAAAGFLFKCDMVFKSQPSIYSTERAKVRFATSLLEGDAQQWVMRHMSDPEEDQPLWTRRWSLFKEELVTVLTVTLRRWKEARWWRLCI